MGSSVAKAAPTTLDKLGVIGRPKVAGIKADDARLTTSDNHDDNPLSPLAKDAVKTAWGTLEAGAAHLQKDKGNFSRDVDAERMTLAQMRQLGPHFLAAFGASLLREYAPLSDPKEHIRQQIRAIRRSLDEVSQFVEGA